MQSFRTVGRAAEAEVVIKKSRFIAAVTPVATEAEAEAFLAAKREEHRNAVHNCYAWRVGTGSVIAERSGDDGEPQGTAGRPMLSVLQREELRNVAVVVTRYFGGVLLGAPGLVRAYAGATKAGVDEAGIVEPQLYELVEAVIAYGLVGPFQHFLEQGGYEVVDSVYGADVTLRFWVLEPEADGVIEQLVNLADGQALLEKREQAYR